jgi:hypothetical protein
MERSGSHLPQALAVKQFMACTIDGWWGFLWFLPTTMLIGKMLTKYRVGGIYVSIALEVEIFGASGTVEVVGVKRLSALWVEIAYWL